MKTTKKLLLLASILISHLSYAQMPCDDFTDITAFPTTDFGAEELITHTQGGDYPVNSGVGATGDFNGMDEIFPGIYIVYGPVEFDFDGTNQEVRFAIYGWFGDGTEDGFSVNGSSTATYDMDFPMTIDGITVDLEDSPEDFGSWHHAYLVLTGEIESVELRGVEFGTTELCVEPIAVEEGCDDFTNLENFPEGSYSSDEVVGYSQYGDFPITNGADTYTWVNSGEDGIYSVGPVNYAFDGTNQSAQFTIYGFYEQYNEMGFNVNGSADAYMDATFPLTLDGITITLDSIETIGSWTYTHLTFNGEIDNINIIGFESGVTELCVEPLLTEDGCDDFTNLDNFPEESYSSDEVIGYSQYGEFPITNGEDTYTWVNASEAGIFSVGSVNFAFDGTNQSAQFTIYGFYEQYNEMGFNVNGSADAYMDASFPMILDGITITLDSIETIGSWTYTHLTFNGEIDNINIIGFESGVTELCVEPIFDADCDNFTNTELWPTAEHLEEGIIGYSQDGTFPITNGVDTYTWVNSTIDGIYSIGPVNFDFDGTNQSAQFTIKGVYALFDDIGFNVNGSSDAFLDESFPMTLDGITITLDSIETVDVWTYTHLTFTGEIDEINIIGFESAVTELCVTEVITTSLETNEKLHYSLYPNPILNNLTITSNTIINNVTIHTLSGELIKQSTPKTNTENIDFTELSSGIYIVQLYLADGSIVSEKLVKQ